MAVLLAHAMSAKETDPEKNSKETDGEKEGAGFLSLLGFLATLVVITGAFYVAMVWLGDHVSADRATNQADRPAVVNAVVSAFAFAALLLALYLQRNELRLQRQELQLQRKELKDTRKVLEEQSKTFRQQSLDDTFFQLLRADSRDEGAGDLQRVRAEPEGGGVHDAHRENVREGRHDAHLGDGREGRAVGQP